MKRRILNHNIDHPTKKVAPVRTSIPKFVIGAAVLCSVTLLAACGKEPYPDSVLQTLTNSCIQSYKAKSPAGTLNVDAKAATFCTCFADGLQKDMSLPDFVSYDRMVATGETGERRSAFDDRTSKVAASCIKQ